MAMEIRSLYESTCIQLGQGHRILAVDAVISIPCWLRKDAKSSDDLYYTACMNLRIKSMQALYLGYQHHDLAGSKTVGQGTIFGEVPICCS